MVKMSSVKRGMTVSIQIFEYSYIREVKRFTVREKIEKIAYEKYERRNTFGLNDV